MGKPYFDGPYRYCSLKLDERKFFNDYCDELETWKLCNSDEEPKEETENHNAENYWIYETKTDKVLSEFERDVLFAIVKHLSSEVSGVLKRDAARYLESGFSISYHEGKETFNVSSKQSVECVRKFIRLDIMREISYRRDQCPYFLVNPWVVFKGTPSYELLNEFKWSRWKMLKLYEALTE